VCASYSPSREEALGDRGSDHLPSLLVPMRTHAVPPHPRPLPPATRLWLPWAERRCCRGAWLPPVLMPVSLSPAGCPARCGAWGWRAGRDPCLLWLAGCLAQGPVSHPSAGGGRSHLPVGGTWCLGLCHLMAGPGARRPVCPSPPGSVVSVGLLFQEKLVSGIRALINLAGSAGRGNKATKRFAWSRRGSPWRSWGLCVPQLIRSGGCAASGMSLLVLDTQRRVLP